MEGGVEGVGGRRGTAFDLSTGRFLPRSKRGSIEKGGLMRKRALKMLGAPRTTLTKNPMRGGPVRSEPKHDKGLGGGVCEVRCHKTAGMEKGAG